ncbi:MAG TPA: alpha-hydroxy acid oxidase [Terriglobales bacterium]
MNSQKIFSLDEAEELSASFMAPMARAYLCGGAGDEITMRANRDDWRRIRLNPRILVDVSEIDMKTEILGETLEWPVLLAPAAFHRLWHRDGERATVAGANQGGVTMVMSTYATESAETLCRAAKRPLWFQVYTRAERDLTRQLVERAENAGCKALVITVDTPVVGVRNREARADFRLPASFKLPNVSAGQVRNRPASTLSLPLNGALTWKDVEWICSIAKVPVLLKGVINPEDALRAVNTGAAGIIVSNHGARNLDTLPSTAAALPRIAEKLQGKLPILVDGGIRRGTDIVKALAMGAKAVLIGRPYLHGLAIAGAAGVARVLEILRYELMAAMALTGRTSIAQIDRSVLWED